MNQLIKKKKPTNPITPNSPFTRFLWWHTLPTFLFIVLFTSLCCWSRKPKKIDNKNGLLCWLLKHKSLFINLDEPSRGDWLGDDCGLIEVAELGREWKKRLVSGGSETNIQEAEGVVFGEVVRNQLMLWV